MIAIIDPPSRFSPLSEWQAFVRRLESLERDNPTDRRVRGALADARAQVDRLVS